MHQLANNEEIDVVYIVLPTSMHAEYSIFAAEAGKHVWCEKPMAKTVQECEAIIAACEKNKRKLSIGYRMQHEPNTQTIMRFARELPYGNIQNVTAKAGYFDGRKDHWKFVKEMGGGAMYDMGVYPVNAARYATGKEPIAITATHINTRTDIFDEVDETTKFTLEFPNDLMMKGATSLGKSMNELQVTCDRGDYYLRPFQSYSGIKGKTSDGMMLNKTIPNQQALQMDNDALAILNNTEVKVPGIEGLRDIKIVEAAYQSAASGKRVLI
jgi:glucose-fructose oxidoreductase